MSSGLDHVFLTSFCFLAYCYLPGVLSPVTPFSILRLSSHSALFFSAVINTYCINLPTDLFMSHSVMRRYESWFGM